MRIRISKGNPAKTPRSVWVTSAIATAIIHLGLINWGLAAWYRAHQDATAAPIRVITIPEGDAGSEAIVPENSVPEAFPDPPASPGSAVPSNTSPVAPKPLEPFIDSSPVVANDAPATPAVSPPPVPSAEPPPARPPIPTRSPEPPPGDVPDATGGAAAQPLPPAPPVQPGGAGTQPDPGTPSTTEGAMGVASSWSLQPLPGGADLHDERPRLPAGWQTATAALLENAACAEGLMAGGDTARVTLWPVVEADGRISEFLPWEQRSAVPASVMQCVTGLRAQLPALIPARDGGEAIASTEVLLTVEVTGQL
ncbi:MAG: hypothetical protein ACFBSG_17205 [Leptolyngbyaceae cyanobacterium]